MISENRTLQVVWFADVLASCTKRFAGNSWEVDTPVSVTSCLIVWAEPVSPWNLMFMQALQIYTIHRKRNGCPPPQPPSPQIQPSIKLQSIRFSMFGCTDGMLQHGRVRPHKFVHGRILYKTRVRPHGSTLNALQRTQERIAYSAGTARVYITAHEKQSQYQFCSAFSVYS